MSETSTAPRASSRRPSRGGRLTRLVTLLAVAATIGAVSSVVTAGIAVSSFYESRRLRAQLEETRIGVPTSLPPPAFPSGSTPNGPPIAPPLDHTVWDALPPMKPIEVDATVFRTKWDGVDSLASDARIVPAFKNGHSVGFKLFSIRPTSFYATTLMLENGDVVRRINGLEMSSPESGLEAYSKLKDAKEFRVDIERRGQPMRLDYVVR